MKTYEAAELALSIHAQQTDKAGKPYIGHLVRVMGRLPPDATELERCAALLHDTLEDGGPGVYGRLSAAGADGELMNLVLALTRAKGEPYADYIARVARSPAWRVKLADLEDNLDPLRLAGLEPGVAARLKAKYELARAALLGARLQNPAG